MQELYACRVCCYIPERLQLRGRLYGILHKGAQLRQPLNRLSYISDYSMCQCCTVGGGILTVFFVMRSCKQQLTGCNTYVLLQAGLHEHICKCYMLHGAVETELIRLYSGAEIILRAV